MFDQLGFQIDSRKYVDTHCLEGHTQRIEADALLDFLFMAIEPRTKTRLGVRLTNIDDLTV